MNFTELANGGDKAIEYIRKELCQSCNGIGGFITVCNLCKGNGYFIARKKGSAYKNKCKNCDGTGASLFKECAYCIQYKIVNVTEKD